MADDTQVIQIPSLQAPDLPQTELPTVSYSAPDQASSLNLADLPAPTGAVGSHSGRGDN